MTPAPRLSREFIIRRIVVAADSSEPGRAALEAAAMLAERLHAEVEGEYAEGTVNRAVQKTLDEFASRARAFAGRADIGGGDNK